MQSIKMPNISSLILAAGVSKRMGKPNKLFLPINGEPMIRVVVKNYLKISNYGLYVVLGYQSEKVKELLYDLSVQFIENRDYELGQMSSVSIGLKNLSDPDHLIIGLGDQPTIRNFDLSLLLKFHLVRSSKKPITIPVTSNNANTFIRGNPTILKNNIIKLIKNTDKNLGCNSFIKNNPSLVNYFKTEIKSFFTDIDTPNNYKNIINKN